MTEFILNDRTVSTKAPAGTTLLDIIRYHEHLPGTKIGCREGDCGACTVLVGELKNGDRLEYRSMTSCLLALANVQGKHIVTVEGLNMDRLSPVQQAMVDESGTQCGFCTPGFVVSLSGCCLSQEVVTKDLAVRAIDGNICRCTGYKSIERAAAVIADKLAKKDANDPIDWSVQNGFLPAYFTSIKERLMRMSGSALSIDRTAWVPNEDPAPYNQRLIAGGTDLYVQMHDTMPRSAVRSVFNDAELKGVNIGTAWCHIGGASVASDLLGSKELLSMIPALERYLLLVSSTPIRNMGTVAGNLVNASPIGDLTVLFLALDSDVSMRAAKGEVRIIELKDLYKGYKQLDKSPDEVIQAVGFLPFTSSTRFNFEKVSKRTHLDIASVNSAIRLEIEGDAIREAHVSAGGVAPIPKYLTKTSAFLAGRSLSKDTVRSAIAVLNDEIAPISDARGTADYKRLLLRQLFFAHFLELFPEKFTLNELVA